MRYMKHLISSFLFVGASALTMSCQSTSTAGVSSPYPVTSPQAPVVYEKPNVIITEPSYALPEPVTEPATTASEIAQTVPTMGSGEISQNTILE